MEKRKIGSLDVSVVGLGCNNFGGRLDAQATKVVVDAAIEKGINFFDTADMYGGTKSEEFLGLALGKRRDDVIVATKFGHKVSEEKQGARPEYIRQAIEDSLRRLGTDRIDLYQLHKPDESVPIADTLGALDELVKAGKVREIGASNFSAAQLRRAEEAVTAGASRFVSLQNEYSLLKREYEADVLPEALKQGVAFLPYFPLASGLLTGKYRQGQAKPEGTRLKADNPALNDDNLAIVEALIQFSETRGHTILELAFSWLASRPTVASVIAGATSAQQIEGNAAAVNWKLSEADLAEIDAILAPKPSG
ncbi:aldo/keto reductase [bacterium]|nr:MAG: aldo/keto reductase [bacterium]